MKQHIPGAGIKKINFGVFPRKTIERNTKEVESMFKEVSKGKKLNWTKREVMQRGDCWRVRKLWARGH